MPLPPAGDLETEVVVARLRAAGCVFAEDEARLLCAEATSRSDLDALVSQRVAGTPLEHVLGWAEFCGLRIAVAPGVFVPRRRTGLLAHEALRLARRALTAPATAGAAPLVAVDMCCGTGAVGTYLARTLDGLDLHAVDVDPVAVACARGNLVGLGTAYEGDLFDALPPELRGRVDLVAANAPYVPTDAIATMPPDARDHEPLVALDGGADGLDVQRRVVAGAAEWLGPGGHLLVETSRQQAPLTVDAFERHGLEPRVVRDEEVDGTVVVGARPI